MQSARAQGKEQDVAPGDGETRLSQAQERTGEKPGTWKDLEHWKESVIIRGHS